jgi:hypothetical protein
MLNIAGARCRSWGRTWGYCSTVQVAQAGFKGTVSVGTPSRYKNLTHVCMETQMMSGSGGCTCKHLKCFLLSSIAWLAMMSFGDLEAESTTQLKRFEPSVFLPLTSYLTCHEHSRTRTFSRRRTAAVSVKAGHLFRNRCSCRSSITSSGNRLPFFNPKERLCGQLKTHTLKHRTRACSDGCALLQLRSCSNIHFPLSPAACNTLRSPGRRSRWSKRGCTALSRVKPTAPSSKCRTISIWEAVFLLWNLHVPVNASQPRASTPAILEMLAYGRHRRQCWQCYCSCRRGCQR